MQSEKKIGKQPGPIINNSRRDDISHHSLGMLGFCHFFFRKLQMPHGGGSSFIQKPHCRALKKI